MPIPSDGRHCARYQRPVAVTHALVGVLFETGFTTFAAIPVRARYQFMLDSSEFFVMNFIRGPVCAGQVATDVIDDQFFVVFQDPVADLSVTDTAYLAKIQPFLVLGPEEEGVLKLAFDWDHRKKERNEYVPGSSITCAETVRQTRGSTT